MKFSRPGGAAPEFVGSGRVPTIQPEITALPRSSARSVLESFNSARREAVRPNVRCARRDRIAGAYYGEVMQ